jgi:acetate kinase
MRVLVVNAGSSSLKLSVLDERDQLLTAEVLPAPGGQVDQAALKELVARCSPIDAVGHRIVHGGTDFTAPVLVDAQVVRRLEVLSDLAPLHQPKSLRGLQSVTRMLPHVPAVACFDTAFHATIPAAAATYALPVQWRRRWDLRRFGFHGLSHSYASRRVAKMLGPAAGPAGDARSPARQGPAPSAHEGPAPSAHEGPGPSVHPDAGPSAYQGSGGRSRLVTCHLGAGASLAAVRDGISVDTTMGFTPNEGLVMATRSGSVDPGLLLWLEEHVGMPSSELASTLEHRSGLLGLCGTADMRAALEAESQGDLDATLAIGVYLHRLRAGIAAMVAALGGLDALVFTGGVGEHSAPIRWRAAEGLGYLGVSLDEATNRAAQPDWELSAAGAAVRSFVIEAREDLEIARGVREVLGDAVPGEGGPS